MAEPTIVAGAASHSTGTATTIVAPLPTGIVTGDVLIIAVAAMSPSGNAFSVPSGWTNLYPTLGTIGSARYGLWAKVYDSSADSSANRTITMSGTARYLQAWSIAYRDVQAIAEWLIGAGKARSDSPASTTVNRALSVTTTDTDARVLAVSFERTSGLNGSTPTVSNATLDYYAAEVDGTNQLGTFLVAHKSMPAVGATGDIDITYPTSNSTNGWAVQIALPGVVDTPTGFEVEVTDGAGGTVPAYAYVWDGSAEVPVQDILALPWSGYTVSEMFADITAGRKIYWAHRCGSLNWPWFSRRAATNAIFHGCKVLELSVWMTTDGVLVCSHDNDRAIATTGTGNITASTLAAVSTDVIDVPSDQGGQTTERLDWFLDRYGQDFVLVIEDKQNVNIPTLITLVNERIPDATEHVVFKFVFDATEGTAPTTVRAAGFKTWMYSYVGNLDDLTDPARRAQCDLLGFDRTASDAQWETVVGYEIPTLAFLVDTPAHVTQANARGAVGYQVRDVLAVVPQVNVLP